MVVIKNFKSLLISLVRTIMMIIIVLAAIENM